MKKITFCLFLLAAILIAPPVFAAGTIRSSEVQKVNLGDSAKKVTRTLGDPKEVVSKEVLPDGKRQEVWRYEVVDRPGSAGNPFSALGGFIYTPPHVDEYGQYQQGSLAGGLVGQSPGESAARRQAFLNSPQGQAERARLAATPAKETCTIVFLERKVTSVKKETS